MGTPMLTLKELKDILDYLPETGAFVWRRTGAIAGYSDSHGYWCVNINKRRYLAHRLAWLFTYGEWPVGILDHVDRDKRNNAIANLRQATKSQNAANSKVRWTNTLGVKGVSVCPKTGKYRARIRVNGKEVHLGLFDSVSAASDAYRKRAGVEFGAFHSSGDCNEGEQWTKKST